MQSHQFDNHVDIETRRFWKYGQMGVVSLATPPKRLFSRWLQRLQMQVISFIKKACYAHGLYEVVVACTTSFSVTSLSPMSKPNCPLRFSAIELYAERLLHASKGESSSADLESNFCNILKALAQFGSLVPTRKASECHAGKNCAFLRVHLYY